MLIHTVLISNVSGLGLIHCGLGLKKFFGPRSRPHSFWPRPHAQLASLTSLLSGHCPSHLRTSARELEATTGATHNLDEKHSWWPVFAGSWDTWGLRSGTESASLQTNVFAQCYTLVVVPATNGLDCSHDAIWKIYHPTLSILNPTLYIRFRYNFWDPLHFTVTCVSYHYSSDLSTVSTHSNLI